MLITLKWSLRREVEMQRADNKFLDRMRASLFGQAKRLARAFSRDSFRGAQIGELARRQVSRIFRCTCLYRILRLCRVWIPKVRTRRTASGKDLRSFVYRSVSAIEMPKSYRRNADEMPFKTLYAKNQMINTVRQETEEGICYSAQAV